MSHFVGTRVLRPYRKRGRSNRGAYEGSLEPRLPDRMYPLEIAVGEAGDELHQAAPPVLRLPEVLLGRIEACVAVVVELPAVKIGCSEQISRKELDRWLEGQHYTDAAQR